ncbi:unnamed protein product [Pneumocystis jirovecii]|uniref:RNA helicase n=1 Tax=Pneumocystis jirovecii TaxID=42068 RepID=L0PBM6_PNEJI|nr:unnamed protein product [Pneumocystis jirovecii]
MKRKEFENALSKRSLQLNNLPWKKVKISCELENLDGFIDLEEIEGINLNIKKKTEKSEEKKEITDKSIKNKEIKQKTLKSDTEANILNKKQILSKKKKKDEKKYSNFSLKPEFIDISQKFDEISTSLPEWTKFGLSDIVLKNLSSLSFLSPTHIQKMTIPSIIEGKSVIAKAETGSGKNIGIRDPNIPTRELAHQIMNHLESISKFSSIFIIAIIGGLSVQRQERLLWEIINQNNYFLTMLSKVRFLVLDEADRLLQEGHFKELEKILNFLKRYKIQRQVLVFSATFKKSLQKKIENSNFFKTNTSTEDEIELFFKKLNFGKEMKFIDANPQENIPKKIKEGIIECKDTDKDLYLYYFLLKYPGRTIVFMNSIEHVHRIVPILNELNLKPLSLHSQLRQKQRLKVIEKFNNEISILITSDIAARGIDISEIDHVIHYHLPRSVDLYIHRSGRTARAENSGVAVLLCTPTETIKFRKMLFSLEKSIDEILFFPIDYSLLKKLKPRIYLGKKITDAMHYLNKQNNNWLKEAAEDLGIDLNELNSKKQDISKKEIQILRLQLKELLSQTLYSGFSQKYLTNGPNNIAQNTIEGKTHPTFLDTIKLNALHVFQKKQNPILHNNNKDLKT